MIQTVVKPTGLRYPFRVSSKGGLSKTDGVKKVVSNLKALVKSTLNERLIRKQVGTIGYSILFRSDVNMHGKTIEGLVFEAITTFEPRAVAVQVKVRAADRFTDHLGYIDVSFVFKNTGDPASFTVTV
jgi:S-adenosylmethionine:diacylglycerol 3-amino-3-carboxypropyl transferase